MRNHKIAEIADRTPGKQATHCWGFSDSGAMGLRISAWYLQNKWHKDIKILAQLNGCGDLLITMTRNNARKDEQMPGLENSNMFNDWTIY